MPANPFDVDSQRRWACLEYFLSTPQHQKHVTINTMQMRPMFLHKAQWTHAQQRLAASVNLMPLLMARCPTDLAKSDHLVVQLIQRGNVKACQA